MRLFGFRRPRLKPGETRALPGGGYEYKSPWGGQKREKSPSWDRRSVHGLNKETEDPYPCQEGYPERPFMGVHVQFALIEGGFARQIPGGGTPQLFHLLVLVDGGLVRTSGLLTNLEDENGHPAWVDHHTERLISYNVVAGWYSH